MELELELELVATTLWDHLQGFIQWGWGKRVKIIKILLQHCSLYLFLKNLSGGMLYILFHTDKFTLNVQGHLDETLVVTCHDVISQMNIK